MGFAKGMQKAEEQAAAHRGGSARSEYFRLAEGETTFLRFITEGDEVISVLQYGYIPTKDAPDWWGDRKWPRRISAVCRLDDGFEGKYTDDPLAEMGEKPKPKVWAWACLREEVYEDGKFVGMRDVTETVERNGKSEKTKAYRLVNQAQSNFFAMLDGYFKRNGTLVDRDFEITRVDRNTYTFVALDPIPGHDLRDPEVRAKYQPPHSLEQEIERLASDEFYALFIDPNRTPEPPKGGRGDSSGAPSSQQQARPSGDATPEEMDAVRARIMGESSGETVSSGMRNVE